MNSDAWIPLLDIPEAALQKNVQDYAPLLRLNATEKHLPARPETFRKISRFRYSKPGKDSGWNKSNENWARGNQHDPEFHDVPWKYILPESTKLLSSRIQPKSPPLSKIRPRDDHNVFGEGTTGEDNLTGWQRTPYRCKVSLDSLL